MPFILPANIYQYRRDKTECERMTKILLQIKSFHPTG